MKKFLVALALFSGIGSISAQTQSEYNSAELAQALKKLNVVGSVLYVAAHPDDENTRLLAYLATEKKLRTGYLSLTRGDGGQNLIGKEQGELLGLIRTNELLAARRTDGAEQFFTRANDFGYSKNPEETFGIWNKDSILADVVWAIRKFRPDVIICRFPTTGEGGHGHHTASALLAEEAFDAAADPARYPEQLTYVSVWQAKRLFWNTFNFGTTNTTSEDQLKIDVGVYNSLLGDYYGEIAANSRSMHKSQGFGSAKSRGASTEYFKQLKGDIAKADLFEGIDQTWKRTPGMESLDKLVKACIASYSMEAPEKSVPQLISIYNTINAVKSSNPNTLYWRTQKLKEVENLLLTCSGFWAEAYASSFSGIAGGTVDVTANVLSKNKTAITLNTISFLREDTLTQLPLKTNEFYTFKHQAHLQEALPYSNPYWLTKAHPIAMYSVEDQLLRGTPENVSQTTVVYDITIGKLNLKVARPLTYKWVDPVKGEVYRPFEVLPALTVNLSEKVLVFPDAQPKTIQLRIKSYAANVSGHAELKAPAGWRIQLQKPDFTLVNKGDEIVIEASVAPDAAMPSGKLQASIVVNGQTLGKSIERIEYDHIPYQFILSDATATLTTIDLKKSGTNIAYIPGAGDDVATCLKQIGYSVTILSDDQIDNADLSQYDAIVTGIRAYNTNAHLQVVYQQLMDYVKNGGNLIVQYNTNSRIGPVIAKIGPLPFTVSRNRVTNEKAAVTFKKPEHSALNFPNKIEASDFDGWIQERGIYFATDLDPAYEAILSMNDPNEKADEGSLIVAKYGKGNFVYTGLVFFRELPAGVPGAYRLLVNLISLPENPAN